MSKAEFYQRGEAIDFVNKTEAIIEANTVMTIGSRIGIAGMTMRPNELGSVHVEGIFLFPKATEEITLGADVYWDASAGKITTASSGNVKAGYATENVAASSETVIVKINA